MIHEVLVSRERNAPPPPPGECFRWERQMKVLRKKKSKNFPVELFPFSRLRFAEGSRAGWADFIADPVPVQLLHISENSSHPCAHSEGTTCCFLLASWSFVLLCLLVCVLYYHIKLLRSSGLFFHSNSVDESKNRFSTLSHEFFK